MLIDQRKIRKKLYCLFGLLMLLSFFLNPLSAKPNEAQAAGSFASLKGVDVMKFTKDTMTNQPSDQEIQNIVSAVKSMNVTHISVSIPMDSDADYPAGGKPSPRTSAALAQKWADTIHGAGLKVIWRGTWSGIEGIYGFPKRVGANRFPTGLAATAETDGSNTWLGKTYQYILNNPNLFQAGDVWAPLPERTEGIFSDSTSFLPHTSPGLQTNFVNFFNDLKTVSDRAFSRLGRTGVLTGMTANNYSEVVSGWLPQSLFDVNGIVAIDYYGINHSAAEMEYDIRNMFKTRGKPVFLQEWGDYWNSGMSQTDRAQYLTGVYSVIERLANEGVLAGFNYWGGWDNSAEGVLTRTATGYGLNYRGELLKNLFAKFPNITNSTQVPAPPAPVPTPAPQPGLTCPAPKTNAFTGCYYEGLGFNKLILSRTDTAIDFTWNDGSPDPTVPKDNFSAKWEGSFYFNQGNYTFTVTADDGVRLYLDNQLVIDQWKDQPATTNSVSRSFPAGNHNVRMEYYEAAGGAVAKLGWKQNSATGNFSTQYFSDMNLSNPVMVRTDSAINFSWGSGRPSYQVPADRFSARWVGSFDFSGGDKIFTVTADDGFRLYVDGNLVLDRWINQPATTYNRVVNLSPGVHTVKLEYFENMGQAVAKLTWR